MWIPSGLRPPAIFHSPRTLVLPGYYQLALADDQFDLLLDAREPEVDLVFNGLPMQEHVQVRKSDENQRLWEYKFASRQAQAIEAAAAQQKLSLQPTDTAALAQLDSISERAERVKQGHLQRLLTQDPSSLFTKTVKADLALISVMRKTPNDVAKTFDFSDPELMRTSMYDKAVMVFLQNMNPVNETQFSVAADTLMALASKDPECKAYMMDHMIDLFATYGPGIRAAACCGHLLRTCEFKSFNRPRSTGQSGKTDAGFRGKNRPGHYT
jgi:hypothetical protein